MSDQPTIFAPLLQRRGWIPDSVYETVHVEIEENFHLLCQPWSLQERIELARRIVKLADLIYEEVYD